MHVCASCWRTGKGTICQEGPYGFGPSGGSPPERGDIDVLQLPLGTSADSTCHYDMV